MSIIGFFAKDWDESPLDGGMPSKPLTLKQYGGTITIPEEGKVRRFYERYIQLAQKYNDEKREACLKIILGVDVEK